ncbi:glycosyl transferase family 1 [Thalassotalea sp. 42_200_T64]|mgnify:CR=1 FL=1|nr:glycosyl transferase family 1 [Thalassotalea sp. 42_200_T64]
MIMKKPSLLFLAHRIPFPPNKGDKIRSFNMLKKLGEQFDVHLGCFIDDPFDQQFVAELKKYCKSLYCLKQNKLLAKVKGLSGFINAKPITLPYYFNRKMQLWVDTMIAEQQIGKIFIYSSSMAQYCQQSKFNSLERVIDFVDVDSDKWRQYAEKKTGVARWFYTREQQLLEKFEDEICLLFNHSLFVSVDEAELFKERQPKAIQSKIRGLLNGVDIKYFDPYGQFNDEPLVPKVPFICFTGAMDYWANVDAVLWFTQFVWPLILKQQQHAVFCIVGGNPSAKVQALGRQKGVLVTGRVKDVRPFIGKADCIVAPLQIARGIQNKVLEAMSLNKAIVVTSMAMAGINAKRSADIDIVNDCQVFADCCIKHLEQAPTLAVDNVSNCDNRAWVMRHFTWQQTLAPLNQLFQQEGAFNESI